MCKIHKLLVLLTTEIIVAVNVPVLCLILLVTLLQESFQFFHTSHHPPGIYKDGDFTHSLANLFI